MAAVRHTAHHRSRLAAISPKSEPVIVNQRLIDRLRKVLRQQETLRNQLPGRNRDFSKILLAAAVTLLNRHPRISSGLPLRTRARERIERPGFPGQLIRSADRWVPV